jgi:uncharacterized protein (DUF2147 family)
MDARRSLRVTAAFAALALSPVAAEANTPTGVWIDHTGRGGIEITDCGKALCGKLVWLKDKSNAKACGTEIIGGVRPVGGGTWDGGWIYSPEKKQKYDVELKPVGGDKLRVVGYAGTKLFSRTMTWNRAPEGLERCDAGETAAAAPVAPTAVATAAAQPAASVAPPPVQAAQKAEAKPATAAPAVQPAEPANDEADEPADKPGKWRRFANAEGGSKKYCRIELPFVTVRVPCPE